MRPAAIAILALALLALLAAAACGGRTGLEEAIGVEDAGANVDVDAGVDGLVLVGGDTTCPPGEQRCPRDCAGRQSFIAPICLPGPCPPLPTCGAGAVPDDAGSPPVDANSSPAAPVVDPPG